MTDQQIIDAIIELNSLSYDRKTDIFLAIHSKYGDKITAILLKNAEDTIRNIKARG